jgi:Type I restriction enzyme HindI endonuclease subunit-like, C-terminal
MCAGARWWRVGEKKRTVKENSTIDWTLQESVRAKLRVLVRRTLRKYGYPPDQQEQATKTVLEQAELLSEQWVLAWPRRCRVYFGFLVPSGESLGWRSRGGRWPRRVRGSRMDVSRLVLVQALLWSLALVQAVVLGALLVALVLPVLHHRRR